MTRPYANSVYIDITLSAVLTAKGHAALKYSIVLIVLNDCSLNLHQATDIVMSSCEVYQWPEEKNEVKQEQASSSRDDEAASSSRAPASSSVKQERAPLKRGHIELSGPISRRRRTEAEEDHTFFLDARGVDRQWNAHWMCECLHV